VKFNDSLNVSQLRVVLHLCGFLVLLYSLSMLPPMVIALLNKERNFFTFLSTFLTFFTLGGIAWRATRHAGIQLRTRDGL
jgi:trk system potassium uptake protein TrkH